LEQNGFSDFYKLTLALTGVVGGIMNCEYIDIISDTIIIQIINDGFLTEKMGTTGAYCYLGETVFTLTENDLIKFVKIEMDSGSHASPGIYNRNDFKDLVK
jgi:hypothetical protein